VFKACADFDVDAALQVGTVHEFDKTVVVPVHKFKDVNDCKSNYKIKTNASKFVTICGNATFGCRLQTRLVGATGARDQRAIPIDSGRRRSASAVGGASGWHVRASDDVRLDTAWRSCRTLAMGLAFCLVGVVVLFCVVDGVLCV
jgi:hypothetical protein